MMYTEVKCSTKYMNIVRQHMINNSSFFRFSWSEEKERSSCSPRNSEGEEVKYPIFIINKYTVYPTLKLTGITLYRLKKKKLIFFNHNMSSSYLHIKTLWTCIMPLNKKTINGAPSIQYLSM